VPTEIHLGEAVGCTRLQEGNGYTREILVEVCKEQELLRCMMMAILVIATEFERRMVERRERTSVSLRTKRTDPQRWTMIPRRGRGVVFAVASQRRGRSRVEGRGRLGWLCNLALVSQPLRYLPRCRIKYSHSLFCNIAATLFRFGASRSWPSEIPIFAIGYPGRLVYKIDD
jgi:hypothetical protein